jgi:hypothetical protein
MIYYLLHLFLHNDIFSANYKQQSNHQLPIEEG